MLAPWKESYDKPRQLLKSRDITANRSPYSQKLWFFPVAIYGCESWTIKKVEQQGTDAFELCWRRLLRVLWRASRQTSQS